ncbi:ImmA/IrrE family metallo-endopeptidase [Curtobacterium sp. 22159]|uniref:ImmA/IrrE family metallo-endopeptidase n=1 Tax=Curtobacterium sp. 22159 TaxID=3453882 RepID=UPI003F8358C6
MQCAAALGVRVVLTHLPDDMIGAYSPLEDRVYLDLGLTPSERRSVLAHELGHVHYGHTCDLGPDSYIERQADAYAATLLVHPEDYAHLEQISTDTHYIAEELDVTPNVIEDFRRYVLKKFGQRTYAGHRLVTT